MHSHDIHINAKKSVLGAASLKFLGHLVDNEGINYWKTELRAFGSIHSQAPNVSFYYHFILGCAGILQLLHSLLTDDVKKNVSLAGNSSKAFEEIKNALARVTLLYHP